MEVKHVSCGCNLFSFLCINLSSLKMVSCAVTKCCSRSTVDKKTTTGVTFHAFPTDPERLKLWISFVNRQNWRPSKSSVLCSKHFLEEHIDRTSLSSVRLRSFAVPTLNAQDAGSQQEQLPMSVVSNAVVRVQYLVHGHTRQEPPLPSAYSDAMVSLTPYKRKINHLYQCDLSNKKKFVHDLDIPTTSSSSAILPSRIQDCSDIHCNEDTKSNACFKESKVSVDALSNILVNILDEMCKVPGIQPFVYPVDPQLDPDYCQVVPNSINLQTIRNNLEQRRYHSRGEFLTDVKQIVENSHIYKTKCKKCSCDRNGRFLHLDCKNSQCVTQKMLNVCLERLNEKNQELLALERVINPLMFNEDQIAFTAILESVVSNKLKSMPEALPFHRPVNKSLVKDYYAVVTKPMDLESISKKVAAHKYHSRHEFLADVEQILHNCILYNGRDSQFTEKATRLVTACKSTLDKFDEGLAPLEKNLLLAQVKATENNDENVMSGDENYNKNFLESASFVKSETDDLIDIKQEEIQGVSDCELTKKLKEEPLDTREVSDQLQVKELEQDVKNVL